MDKIKVFIKARKNNTMFFAQASVGAHTFPEVLVYRPGEKNPNYHLLTLEEKMDGEPTGKMRFQRTDGTYPADYRNVNQRGKTIYRMLFRVTTEEGNAIQKEVVTQMAKLLNAPAPSDSAPASDDIPSDVSDPEETTNGTPAEGGAFE